MIEQPLHYALIFRATRSLTAEELKQRAGEITAWAKHVEVTGITLDPRNFGEVAANLSAEGNEIVSREKPGDPRLGTMVFFDAPNRDEAVNIARMHPGLNYGVTVEVREWTSPRGISARQ